MKRLPSSLKLVRYLHSYARQLRRGRVCDLRILAGLLERAAAELQRLT